MSTTYPTNVRIGPGIDIAVPTPVLLGLYGILWVGLTLGGGIVSLLVADAIGGVAGAVVFLTVGLGFVAAGPTLARLVILSLLAMVE